LRLERELSLQNQPNSHGMVDPRRAELVSRWFFDDLLATLHLLHSY
jgi:hypothetical protein